MRNTCRARTNGGRSTGGCYCGSRINAIMRTLQTTRRNTQQTTKVCVRVRVCVCARRCVRESECACACVCAGVGVSAQSTRTNTHRATIPDESENTSEQASVCAWRETNTRESEEHRNGQRNKWAHNVCTNHWGEGSGGKTARTICNRRSRKQHW